MSDDELLFTEREQLIARAERLGWPALRWRCQRQSCQQAKPYHWLETEFYWESHVLYDYSSEDIQTIHAALDAWEAMHPQERAVMAEQVAADRKAFA